MMGTMAMTACADSDVLTIGRDWQYLIDDALIDNRWALRYGKQTMVHRFHRPVKYEGNPVIPAGGGYPCVRYDEQAGVYRMWYQTSRIVRPRPNLKVVYAIAYAESPDGVNWTRPPLNRISWAGSKENNIVWRSVHGTGSVAGGYVLDLPAEHRNGHRFVMLYKAGDGVHLVGSDDGINWDIESDRLIAHNFRPDTLSTIVFDPLQHRFFWYCRATSMYTDRGGALTGGMTRRVAMLSNDSLWRDWGCPPNITGRGERQPSEPGDRREPPVATLPRNILIPDNLDAKEDFNFFYGMPTRYHGGVFWGFLWPFRHNTVIQTELATSRDGVTFRRFPGRPPLLAPGPDGAWDDGMVLASPSWIEKDGRWWFYYAGSDGPHKSHDRTMGIGAASIRKGGFISLHGPSRGGVAVTRPIRWPGGQLRVNLEAPKGSLAVRITDALRRPIAHFSYDTCRPLENADATDLPVCWKDSDLNDLAGQIIRLEFQLTNADLYGFRADRADP
jgi:hypothetical protein